MLGVGMAVYGVVSFFRRQAQDDLGTANRCANKYLCRWIQLVTVGGYCVVSTLSFAR